ncbi:ferredoxin reductase domain-containing protein [Glaciimonas soli]|uniref:hypothetical protein n=1 Tax=Glaciimonas soli TaxID=2590999 RepID=UPI001D1742FF|nr:hypothetical protein [Glaciimonas soli]
MSTLQNLTPQALAAQLVPLPHREYSISSIMEDGRLELLVRRMEYPDGRPGLDSGWSTEHAELGAKIALRVRDNRSFHGPDDERPMILIGNGTGLAGLRAHLKERVRRDYMRNWLLLGERSRDSDSLYANEISDWQKQGVLERTDLAFSRDQTPRI